MFSICTDSDTRVVSYAGSSAYVQWFLSLCRGIPTVPGTVTLKKDSQNLIGISIGGGAQYCPCLYIVQVGTWGGKISFLFKRVLAWEMRSVDGELYAVCFSQSGRWHLTFQWKDFLTLVPSGCGRIKLRLLELPISLESVLEFTGEQCDTPNIRKSYA